MSRYHALIVANEKRRINEDEFEELWDEGYLTALANYSLITEDEFEELMRVVKNKKDIKYVNEQDKERWNTMIKWRSRIITLIELKTGKLPTLEWNLVSDSDLVKIGEAFGIATSL